MSNATPHIHLRKSIDAHFAARIRPNAERRLRAHLPTCTVCRAYYERCSAFAQIDPLGKPDIQRMGVGLGMVSLPRRSAVWTAGLAVVLTACLALFFAPVRRDNAAFTARGGGTVESAQLWLYGVGSMAGELGDEISEIQEIAFAYENLSGKTFLMVFAVDDTGRVYWYYPAWTDPNERPKAIEIPGRTPPRELPEAIKHRIEGNKLRVFGVFMEGPMDVREVEDLLPANAYERETLPIPNSIQWNRPLRVLHP